MWLTECAVASLGRLDIVALGFLVSKQDLGRYTFALLLTQPVAFLINGLFDAATPQMTHEAGGEPGSLPLAVRRVTRLASFSAVPVGIVIFCLASPLARLAGPDFGGIGAVVGVLILAHLISALLGPGGQLLNMTGGEHRNTAITWVTLLASIAAVAAGVPLLGIAGAATARLLGATMIGVMTNFNARATLGFMPLIAAWQRASLGRP